MPVSLVCKCCMLSNAARAQVEASSARSGIGVVKLMGRQSGFIAVQASMASGDGMGEGAGPRLGYGL